MKFLYHPLIVHFPVALWLTSALFDALYLSRGDRFFDRAARLLIGLGLIGAVASHITGFIDYRPLVAEGIGPTFVAKHRVHSLLAYGATLVYLVSFLLRRRPRVARAAIAVLMGLGAVLTAATGYIGGDLRGSM